MPTREIRYAWRASNSGVVEDTVRRCISQVVYSSVSSVSHLCLPSVSRALSFSLSHSPIAKIKNTEEKNPSGFGRPTYQRLQIRDPAALDKRAVELALNAALKGRARLAAERTVTTREVLLAGALQHVAAADGALRGGRGEEGGCGRGEEGEGEEEEEGEQR